MPLSRKTKRAKAAREKNKTESPRSRKIRLNKMKERMKLVYSQLSQEEKKYVSKENNARKATRQGKKTRIEREQRLQSMREYISQSRENESPSSLKARLDFVRKYISHSRENESPSSRTARLETMREYISHSRENESPTSRTARLNQVSQTYTQLSPVSREDRLSVMRNRSRARRQLYNKFDEEISQIAIVPCYVCTKLLYPKQYRNVNVSASLTVLPSDAPQRITCCCRCASKIAKNQCPSNAFWNNMTVPPIPEELACLSEIELRLISRIKPFIKVLRLGGRYGQQGFKGQAILFAQQVEEVAEQLPLCGANMGIAIVTENLENITGNRRYSVDTEKIKKALSWLVQNNHLYRNVQINFDISDEELHQSILQAITISQAQRDINGIQTPQTHFKQIDDNKTILCGTFHQGNERFGGSSGRQCTGMAATAIAYSEVKSVSHWNSSDVDRVLLAGNTYYIQCLSSLANEPQYLNTEELLPLICVASSKLNLEIQPDVVIGIINPRAPNEIIEGYFNGLIAGLENFFLTSNNGIVTCETQISVAVMHLHGEYYLFDSHAHGPKGHCAGRNGTAMVMKFNNNENLCHHLTIVLGIRKQRNLQYSVTAVKPTLARGISMELVHENVPNPTVAETEFDGHIHDGQVVTTSLMPIDSTVPALNEVLSDENEEDETIPIHNLKRKTAPPISIFREKRAEELAWVKLFPEGTNGLKEDRPVSITPLDYYQTRIMSNKKRFQNNEYLFYALSIVELCKAQQNVSVCAKLRQNGAQPNDVVQNVHLMMRNIRGTSSYWHKAFTDLLAMVKNLGPPHWYLTFSCNDLNWPDILKALLVADDRPNALVEELTFPEKLHLVEQYPVTLSRQFMIRINALFKRLKQKENPLLGKYVVDFWWRVEFQLRGSPHVHMVVWCEQMPAFDSPQGVKLLDQVVTCNVPDPGYDKEMHDLVVKLQTHKHTHTCFKENTICRFAFPRPVSNVTKILDEDQTTRNKGKFYILKRKENETMINSYNTEILKMWSANIDIQPCGSALGIAIYISKYISKSEPTKITRSIREAIKRVREQGGDVSKQVFAIQNAILTHREVSACECAFRLCHLKLRDSSRKSVFVNSCIPEERYRMLRIDSESSEPFKNIFDRYVCRPRDLENLSLGEFAVWYDVVTKQPNYIDDDEQDMDAYEDQQGNTNDQHQYITLLDNAGRMKKRKRPAILRTRYFTLASNPEAYYYSLLVVHIPFRAESELLDGFDSAKNAFYTKRNLLRPLQEGTDVESFVSWEIEIQNAISRVVAENMAAESIFQNTDGNEMIDPIERVIAADVYIDDFEDAPTDIVMSDDQYQASVTALNIQQRQLFNKVANKLLQNVDVDESLRIFVTGGAGSGKTFVLKLLVEQIRRLGHDDFGKNVIVTAPTGVAARLIGGSTLHSTFALPIEKGRTEALRPIAGERLQKERQKWRNVRWLIIDEISMVPYLTLRNVHLRLQQYKQNEAVFGGVNILLFGDIMQLPPVSKVSGGSYCFRQPEILSAEINFWYLFNFCELPQNMRQAGDTTFVDILNSLRVGELTMQQLSVIEGRRVALIGPFSDGEAVRIFPTTRLVDAYNTTITAKLEKVTKVYTINAVDISLDPKTYGQKPRKEYIPEDPNKTGGIPNQLKLGVGSRAMLRRNINVNQGLVNGAMGVIRRIDWPALRRQQLEAGELPHAVFVEFDDSSITGNQPGIGVRIEPCTSEFDALRGKGKIERRMLPLILCWAVTVHKLQGTTLDRAVVDLSSHLFAKGQAYVALSRVRSLSGLAISSLDPKKLLNQPHDKNSLNELNRLRNLSN